MSDQVVLPRPLSRYPIANYSRAERIRKGKSCDIGYVLTAGSYERVSGVDPCTVAAFDATTAFAVPNLNGFSQRRRFFRVRLSSESPRLTDHSAYFGQAAFLRLVLSAIDLLRLCRSTFDVCDVHHIADFESWSSNILTSTSAEGSR